MERETQRTLQQVARERAVVARIEEETATEREVLRAERDRKTAEIAAQRRIAEKEADARVAAIEDDIHAAKVRTQADAERYSVETRSQGNLALHTPEFLEVKTCRSPGHGEHHLLWRKIGVLVDSTA